MSDIILAGDDGRIYRISRSDLDQYEIDEEDPVAEQRGTLTEAARATKKAGQPIADACWLADACWIGIKVSASE
jgi:hypothetical protein